MDGARKSDNSEKHKYTRVYVYVHQEEQYVHEYISENSYSLQDKKKLDIKTCWTGRKLEIKKFPRLRIRARRKTLILEVVVKRI